MVVGDGCGYEKSRLASHYAFLVRNMLVVVVVVVVVVVMVVGNGYGKIQVSTTLYIVGLYYTVWWWW